METNSLGGGGVGGSGGGGGGGGAGAAGGGGMFSGMNSSMLGLELPLHQNPTNPTNPHQLHHPPMVSYVQHDPHHHQQPPSVSVKYPFPTKAKPQQSNLSDDEEQGFAADDSNGDGKKKISPWQRMKWTDMMVRLLITAVFYIGDEGGSEPVDHVGKKKPVGLHNTCRHSTTHPSPDAATEPSHLPQQQQQQQLCFHATDTTTSASVAAGECSKSGDEEDEEEEEDESEEEEEDEETEGRQEEEEETESRKRARKGGITAGMQQLSAEVMGVISDGGRSPWEKKQWMKSRLIQLEEQKVSWQTQAFELEKQRLKWVKFRSKKERDMERAKLENEKRMLENERMMLIVKKNELDLMGMQHYQQQQQHSSNKRGDPSSITG